MNDMVKIIRPSTEEDIPRLMSLYEVAKGIMRADGNMGQWVNGYPSEEILRQDIRDGVSYVVEEGDAVVGTFACVPGDEPTYRRIFEGKWLDEDLPYVTVHRLGSTPESHGVADACFSWALAQCGNVRVDTHRDNRIMQHCVLSFGFKYCGIIYLANGDERLAYQLISI